MDGDGSRRVRGPNRVGDRLTKLLRMRGTEAILKRLLLVGAVLALAALVIRPRESDLSRISSEPNTALLLPTEYLEAATALASDDFRRAREHLKSLAGTATGKLQERAQEAADAHSMAAMRIAFKALSEEAIAHTSYPDDYAVAFCPDYRNGAKWIQKREARIANPYLGKSGDKCGFFVD